MTRKYDEKVNPSHYKVGGVETIDYIKAKMTQEQYEGYLLGNVIKYISRFQHKNGAEDLRKAHWYLTKLIDSSWHRFEEGTRVSE